MAAFLAANRELVVFVVVVDQVVSPFDLVVNPLVVAAAVAVVVAYYQNFVVVGVEVVVEMDD